MSDEIKPFFFKCFGDEWGGKTLRSLHTDCDILILIYNNDRESMLAELNKLTTSNVLVLKISCMHKRPVNRARSPLAEVHSAFRTNNCCTSARYCHCLQNQQQL